MISTRVLASRLAELIGKGLVTGVFDLNVALGHIAEKVPYRSPYRGAGLSFDTGIMRGYS
jgi:hypothetical protein